MTLSHILAGFRTSRRCRRCAGCVFFYIDTKYCDFWIYGVWGGMGEVFLRLYFVYPHKDIADRYSLITFSQVCTLR